jgi:hypothetical protein
MARACCRLREAMERQQFTGVRLVVPWSNTVRQPPRISWGRRVAVRRRRGARNGPGLRQSTYAADRHKASS